MTRNPVVLLTRYTLEELRENIKVGQKIITNKVPWSSGQGKSSYELRLRVGKVAAKYPHFFVVQFPQYRECFLYTDIVADTVRLYDDEEEDKY